MKKLVVSVTNDLVNDQRVQRNLSVWRENGVDITLIGRLLPCSKEVDLPYQTIRFKLPFRRGFLFYASYNLRLYWHLLWHPYDIYLANDLDTLLPNFLISRWRDKPLVYDSHEYFTGVPEIQHRPLVKKVWQRIEKWCFPGLQYFMTVNKSIAGLYREDYGIQALVVRNVSSNFVPHNPRSRKSLGLPQHDFILINQGTGINVDRGMEEMLEAMPGLPGVHLLLVGKGDVLPILKKMTKERKLSSRVTFIEPLPYHEMLEYTLAADCGLSLDKTDNVNYKYSLPNKIFDYIKCQKPVVVSKVVEVSALVREYDIGQIVESHRAEDLQKAVMRIKENYEHYRAGLQRAARENHWENESKKLDKWIKRILGR